MNWKNELQLSDLDPDQVLEFMCIRCGHTHLKRAAELQAENSMIWAWLDQIEGDEVCKKRGCSGNTRMSIYHNNSTSGFVGGLA